MKNKLNNDALDKTTRRGERCFFLYGVSPRPGPYPQQGGELAVEPPGVNLTDLFHGVNGERQEGSWEETMMRMQFEVFFVVAPRCTPAAAAAAADRKNIHNSERNVSTCPPMPVGIERHARRANEEHHSQTLCQRCASRFSVRPRKKKGCRPPTFKMRTSGAGAGRAAAVAPVTDTSAASAPESRRAGPADGISSGFRMACSPPSLPPPFV